MSLSFEVRVFYWLKVHIEINHYLQGVRLTLSSAKVKLHQSKNQHHVSG